MKEFLLLTSFDPVKAKELMRLPYIDYLYFKEAAKEESEKKKD